MMSFNVALRGFVRPHTSFRALVARTSKSFSLAPISLMVAGIPTSFDNLLNSPRFPWRLHLTWKQAGDVFAQRDGAISKPSRLGDHVDQSTPPAADGVGDAVRCVRQAAELVGNRVNVAEAGVVESDSRQVFRIGQLVAGFQIVAVGNGARRYSPSSQTALMAAASATGVAIVET